MTKVSEISLCAVSQRPVPIFATTTDEFTLGKDCLRLEWQRRSVLDNSGMFEHKGPQIRPQPSQHFMSPLYIYASTRNLVNFLDRLLCSVFSRAIVSER